MLKEKNNIVSKLRALRLGFNENLATHTQYRIHLIETFASLRILLLPELSELCTRGSRAGARARAIQVYPRSEGDHIVHLITLLDTSSLSGTRH